jgi:hypothetical protein
MIEIELAKLIVGVIAALLGLVSAVIALIKHLKNKQTLCTRIETENGTILYQFDHKATDIEIAEFASQYCEMWDGRIIVDNTDHRTLNIYDNKLFIKDIRNL